MPSRCFQLIYLGRTLALTENAWVIEGVEMNPVLLGTLWVASPLAAVGFYKLQAHLEQWDARRHAED